MAYDKGGGKILGSTALKILYPETGFPDFMHWLESNDDDEKHFRIGRALDARLCQNTVVKIFEIPKLDSEGKEFTRSKAGKEVLARMESSGHICLKGSEYGESNEIVLIDDMVKALETHPIAGKFFDKNNPNIKFQHVLTEPYFLENSEIVTLRKTHDMVYLADPSDDKSVLFWCDLKSTCKTSHDDFNYQFKQLHYDIQAALYNRGLEHLDCACSHPFLQGFSCPVFYIAVSSEPPHHVFISEIGDDVIKHGWSKCVQALKNLSDGKFKQENGQYIGYTGIKKIGGFTQQTKNYSDSEIGLNENGEFIL